MSPSPNKKIEHITEIHAPVDKVWGAMIDIDDWSWNKWTRLNAEKAEEGIKGKLKASYEGDDNWEKPFDFEFGEVNHKSYVLTWFGNIGPGGCIFNGYHTMRLEVIEGKDGDSNSTRLIHTENFGGILPYFSLVLPFATLDRNYLLMNESLKEYVETKK